MALYLPTPGNPGEENTWGQMLCDWLRVEHDADGKHSSIVPAVYVKNYATSGAGTPGDPWLGWDTATPWAADTTFLFHAGTYSFATWPDTAKFGIRLVGLGKVILKHTGTGNAVVMDGGAGGSGIFNVGMENFIIYGNANTTNGLYSRAIHHSCFKDIRVSTVSNAGLYAIWNVGNHWINFTMDSANEPHDFTPVPIYGTVLDKRSGGEDTNACTFTNLCLGYGPSGTGIYIKKANSITFLGGFAEAWNIGLQVDTGSNYNNFYGMDFESNTTADIYDNSSFTAYYGVYSTVLTHIGSAALGVNLHGGTYNDITIDSGAKSTGLFGISYGVATGVITNNGTKTTKINAYKLNAGTTDQNIIQSSYVLADPATPATPLVLSTNAVGANGQSLRLQFDQARADGYRANTSVIESFLQGGPGNFHGELKFWIVASTVEYNLLYLKSSKAINLPLIDTYIFADNAAALAGGLVAGDVYRTSTGVLMVVYTP